MTDAEINIIVPKYEKIIKDLQNEILNIKKMFIHQYNANLTPNSYRYTHPKEVMIEYLNNWKTRFFGISSDPSCHVIDPKFTLNEFKNFKYVEENTARYKYLEYVKKTNDSNKCFCHDEPMDKHHAIDNNVYEVGSFRFNEEN